MNKNLHHESKDSLHVAPLLLFFMTKISLHIILLFQNRKTIILWNLTQTDEIRTEFFLFCFSKSILATLQEQILSSYLSVNYQHIILHLCCWFYLIFSFVNCMTCNKKKSLNIRKHVKRQLLSNLTLYSFNTRGINIFVYYNIFVKLNQNLAVQKIDGGNTDWRIFLIIV